MLSDALAPPAASVRFSIRNLAPILRPFAEDMAATILFAGLFALTRNIYLSTGAGIAIGIGAIAWRLVTRRPIAALQWAGLGLVLVMGSAAILTRDPRIVMIKPTIVYLTVGAAMLQRGWILRYSPPVSETVIPKTAFIVAGYGWAALMFVSAGLNLFFALETGPKTWAAFVAVYPMASKCAAGLLQGGAFTLIARRNKLALRASRLAMRGDAARETFPLIASA